MKQKAAAVSRAGQKTGENTKTAQRLRHQLTCDLTHCRGLDVDCNLTAQTIFKHLTGMLEPEIQRWNSSRGVSHGTTLNQLGRQHQMVAGRRTDRCGHNQGLGQALESWVEVLRASSFSTAFIITDGVVSAFSLATVKCRSTASL